MKYNDRGSYLVSRPNGYRLFDRGHGITIGCVPTRHGFVSVYGQYPDFAELQIVIDGRCYSRTFKRGFSNRGLVTKAAEFAEDIAKGAAP